MDTHVLAQIRNPVLPELIGDSSTATGGSAIGLLVGNIVGGIMIIGFLLAFFILLSGGISWITAGGDKAQLENARNKIINAIIGLIVVAAVWAVMALIAPFLGLTFPDLPIPTIEEATNSVQNNAGAGSSQLRLPQKAIPTSE
jgi:hypothetical protein